MSNGGSSRSTSSSFHFIAGLGSGVFTAVLLQPADLLKTRIQQAGSQHTSLLTTIRAIAASPDPIRQFWRGTAPSAIRTGLGSALYFGGLNALRQRLAQIEGLSSATPAPQSNGKNAKAATTSSSASGSSTLPRLSALANLTTGAVARASAGFAMMPITVIKVRFESSYYNYTSIASAAADILRKEGVRGFFAGFGATAVRDAPYAGLYVLFYEASKKRLSAVVGALDSSARAGAGEGNVGGKKREGKGMSSTASAAVNFVSGIVAAVAGTAITNPFDAIKTRLQLKPGVYGNMVKAGRMMVREEGVRSLFDGLGLRIGRKAVSSALAWTVYEELIRRAEMRWKDPVVL